jgi:hypothetical protein
MKGRKKLPPEQKKVKIANVWGTQKDKEIFNHVATNYPELYDKAIRDFIEAIKGIEDLY